MSLECFFKPWKMRQNNELHADLLQVSYLIVQEKRFFVGLCRNIIFWGVRAEIVLSRVIATRLFCAGPFLGVVQKYKLLEKYSPLAVTLSLILCSCR